MDAARKRRTRAVILLTVALLLAGALIYTSFSAATEATTPSQLVASAEPDRSYELTGKVVDGSVSREGERLRFAVRDRAGRTAIPVVYEGVVPDPFREGREVIVEGRVVDGTLMADRDSLVTKCPSKFTEEQGGQG
ncbi:MAG: cytochrome c maturation protein CcmE [Thermoleophilaceae bacterium]|nr:cytochrome c maturation protein CcmE [Thermoleophilaceae bacterium]